MTAATVVDDRRVQVDGHYRYFHWKDTGWTLGAAGLGFFSFILGLGLDFLRISYSPPRGYEEFEGSRLAAFSLEITSSDYFSIAEFSRGFSLLVLLTLGILLRFFHFWFRKYYKKLISYQLVADPSDPYLTALKLFKYRWFKVNRIGEYAIAFFVRVPTAFYGSIMAIYWTVVFIATVAFGSDPMVSTDGAEGMLDILEDPTCCRESLRRTDFVDVEVGLGAYLVVAGLVLSVGSMWSAAAPIFVVMLILQGMGMLSSWTFGGRDFGNLWATIADFWAS